MTEYDYSPEAYERFIATQNRVAHWIDHTEQHRREYEPAVPDTPSPDFTWHSTPRLPYSKPLMRHPQNQKYHRHPPLEDDDDDEEDEYLYVPGAPGPMPHPNAAHPYTAFQPFPVPAPITKWHSDPTHRSHRSQRPSRHSSHVNYPHRSSKHFLSSTSSPGYSHPYVYPGPSPLVAATIAPPYAILPKVRSGKELSDMSSSPPTSITGSTSSYPPSPPPPRFSQLGQRGPLIVSPTQANYRPHSSTYSPSSILYANKLPGGTLLNPQILHQKIYTKPSRGHNHNHRHSLG